MQNALVRLGTTLSCSLKNMRLATLIVKEIEFFHYQNGSKGSMSQRNYTKTKIYLNGTNFLTSKLRAFNI